jgi:hypothetical protein
VTEVWVTIFALCGTLVVTKGIGPAALGNRALSPALTRVIDLLAPAILAALIAVGTFTNADGDLVLDARAAGLAAAGAVFAVNRKAMLWAVAAAAVTAAVVRAIA